MKCAELLYISARSAASHSGIPFDRIYFYYYLLSKALYLCEIVNGKYNMHIPHLH